MEVAVTCCAGDAACPIAVAMALLRAPILTVTEEDDEWKNCSCEVFGINWQERHLEFYER